ncbi:MAG: uL15m family ribosomal protein [Candidatus Woesearchaeota archaeon]
MTINKRKKNSRQRGSMSHGWGAKKKHRGAGNRGGRGMAGTGKRGDQKKISILKIKNYFGKHGFKIKGNRPTITAINVEELNRFGKETINLTELGYNKLLGNGRPGKKYNITVESCSEKAKQKIEEAGGKVNTPAKA